MFICKVFEFFFSNFALRVEDPKHFNTLINPMLVGGEGGNPKRKTEKIGRPQVCLDFSLNKI